MKKISTLLVLAAASFAFNTAQAHGGTVPDHEGGIVDEVGDMSFELVPHANSAELYVEDDGEDLPSEGLTAKLTVVNKDGSKSEATMKPAGGNKLEATNVKLGSGAKVAVLVTLKDKKKIPANFKLK